MAFPGFVLANSACPGYWLIFSALPSDELRQMNGTPQ